MATNEADLGGRLFPGGEAQRGLTPDSTNAIQLPESEVVTLESTTIPRQIPPTEVPHNRFDRRGILKMGLGVGAALGAAALGRIIIPGLSGDGDGSGGDGGSGSQPIQAGETPVAQETQSPVGTATSTSTKTPEGKPTLEEEKNPTTLREAADRAGFKIGVLSEAGGNDVERIKILKDQFNQLVISSIAMNIIRPDRDSFDFKIPDYYVDMAQRNKQDALGMHLVWGFEGGNGLPSEIPSWLKNGQYSRDELIGIMKEHVATTVGRYKGKMDSWTVVNEAVLNPNNFWARGIGPDYVDIAFETARAADPSAKLVYNDSGNEYSGAVRAEKIYSLVKRLKEKGILDGVGMHAHFTGGQSLDPLKPPTVDQMSAEMRRYGEIGVDVYTTELDVTIDKLPGTTEEKLKRQAELFVIPIQAARDSNGACKNISIWGVNDEFSWKKAGTPLLFANNQPKEAYHAVLKELSALPKKS